MASRRRSASHRPLSIESSHWRSDGRPKVRYNTRDKAISATGERFSETGISLEVYLCDFCHGWHMGHPHPDAPNRRDR